MKSFVVGDRVGGDILADLDKNRAESGEWANPDLYYWAREGYVRP